MLARLLLPEFVAALCYLVISIVLMLVTLRRASTRGAHEDALELTLVAYLSAATYVATGRLSDALQVLADFSVSSPVLRRVINLIRKCGPLPRVPSLVSEFPRVTKSRYVGYLLARALTRPHDVIESVDEILLELQSELEERRVRLTVLSERLSLALFPLFSIPVVTLVAVLVTRSLAVACILSALIAVVSHYATSRLIEDFCNTSDTLS